MGYLEWIRAKKVPLAITIFIVWILATIQNMIRFDSRQTDIKKLPQTHRVTPNRNFLILFYIYPFWFRKVANKINFYKDCKYKNCNVTFDQSMLSQSDVVIFYHVGMKTPPPKLPNQIWIFASMESPYSTHTAFKNAGFRNKFDWTMTYRHDSEGFIPYGFVKRRNRDLEKDYKYIYQRKTKEVAWVVSHCKTIAKREKYVQDLAKYIGVDTYGKCGQPCKTNSVDNCKKILSKSYKFYLSFENSLCKDYMTEKILTIYKDNMNFIPVVRGAPNAKDYLPKNTFVFASDFISPKELAEYLKRIGQNETLYTSILKEKDKFYFQSNSYFESGMCNICERLNTNYTQYRTNYLEQWLWNEQCTEPTDIDV